MTNSNVETLLRGWKPRSPRPGVKRRIFAAPRPARREAPEPAFALNLADFSRWFVPAAGCFLLALSSLGTRIDQPYLIGSTNDLLPESGKARYAAYVSAPAFHSEMNSVPVTRLESSIGSRNTPSSRLPALLQFTNHLIR